MRKLRALLLGGCAAAALWLAGPGARAAGPLPGEVLYDAAGRPVAVLVPLETAAPAAVPAPELDPLLRLAAAEDAMMAGMLARLHALAAALAAPESLALPPGTRAVVSTFMLDGRGVCGRTVTYEGDGSGAPVVRVRESGSGCGSAGPQPDAGAAPAAAAPEPAAPAVETPRLIRAGYRHLPAPPTAARG
jgi:hypothetical protein